MISDQISNLIDQTKQHPNSLARNKIVSHLEDAKAHAFVLERDEFMNNPTPSQIDDVRQALCICPAPGVRNRSCPAPVHK